MIEILNKSIRKNLDNLIVISIILYAFVFLTTLSYIHLDIYVNGSSLYQAESKQIKDFEDWNCGINSEAKVSSFVTEFVVPEVCSIPIAITYDEKDNKVWFISTRNGTLFGFDPVKQEFESFRIPIWYTRDLPVGNSWSWDIKLDNSKNNLWFTDEKSNSIWKFNKNEKKFYQYLIPYNSDLFSTSYPISLDFDNNNNLYFIGIRSLSLWHGEIDKMKNGTSNGIYEIPIPLKETFLNIPSYEVGLGSLAIDNNNNNNNNIWITALAFGKKGAIIKYDSTHNSFSIFELPATIKSPTGITVDNDGNVWITDHATSSFYRISPANLSSNITKTDVEHYVTSPLSSRIIGIEFDKKWNDSINLHQNTLPYWINAAEDNLIWTNEHVGNRIAKFIQDNETLVEYWIPSQNKHYSICNPDEKVPPCGYSNALQFDIQSNQFNSSNKTGTKVWFSEQSENKIGYIDSDKNLPISLSIKPQIINMNNSNNSVTKIEVSISKNNTLDKSTKGIESKNYNDTIILKPVMSGTFTPNGNLDSLQVDFSPDFIQFNSLESPLNKIINIKTIDIFLKRNQVIAPGTYNLMVGVEGKDFSILKKVKLNVVD